MIVLRHIAKKFEEFTTTKIDEVSSIRRIDRDAYRYSEGERALNVQVEVQCGPPEHIVYASTIHQWMPPYDHEEISQAHRAEILRKVCKFLDAHGVSYEVLQ